MNKLIKMGILIFLLVPNITDAQEILNIDYGETYLNLKEMSYREFSKDQYSYKSPLSRNIKNQFGAQNGSYPGKNFVSILLKKNRNIGKEYEKAYDKLKKEFGNYTDRKYWSAFDKGSKKGYDFLQLYIEKFEIISEHYRELYNLALIIEKQKNEIKEANSKLDKKYSNLINNYKKETFESSASYNSLKKKSNEQIKNIEVFFQTKEEELEVEIKRRIDKLGQTNYRINKERIINEYKPIIINFLSRKKDSLSNIKSYWDDKIQSEVFILKEMIVKKTSFFLNENVKEKSLIRKNIKLKYNLKSKENLLFEKYRISIDKINTKIKNSL